MTLIQNTAGLIFQRTPIDGSIANRRLGISARDIPNNFVATATVPARFGVTVSAILHARSGTPYAYTAGGDANADGTVQNDLLYIPQNAGDITLADPSAYSALDAFIESEPCLRSQRGSLMKRNSCRNPGVTSLDMRLAKSFSFAGAKPFEITADIFNLPNLLSRNWGVVHESSSVEEKLGLLTVSGWDAPANRVVYAVPTLNGVPLMPTRNNVVQQVSRWRMQIGARYSF